MDPSEPCHPKGGFTCETANSIGSEMGRCEGFYRLENRRCDRDGEGVVRTADGELYFVCGYHRRHAWTANVARWQGETGLRASRPTRLGSAGPNGARSPGRSWRRGVTSPLEGGSWPCR
jgi:hypothetical protein